MFTAQRVFCVARMIENECFPAFIDVTGFAFCAEVAFVFIVFFMAGNASGRRAFEFGIAMTILAGNVTMFAG